MSPPPRPALEGGDETFDGSNPIEGQRVTTHRHNPHKIQVVLLQGALLLWSWSVLWRTSSASFQRAIGILPGADAVDATRPLLAAANGASSRSSRPQSASSVDEPRSELNVVDSDDSYEPLTAQTNPESPEESCETSTTQMDGDASKGLERFFELPPRFCSHRDTADNEKQFRRNADSSPLPEIIIVSTVDGTLAGLCKETGRVLWKRSSSPTTPGAQALSQPLISTTTTKQLAKQGNSEWKTAAVPSIDGSVYLTAFASDAAQTATAHSAPKRGEDVPSSASASSALSEQEVTVTTSLPELVARAPFVDARGRIYTGSRRATTFALDSASGELLHVLPDWERGGGSTDAAWRGAGPHPAVDSLLQQSQGSRIVWLGRVDYSVAIHEPQTGQLDVQFAAGSILGAQDLWLGSTTINHPPQEPWTESASSEASSLSESVVATPNGNVAFRGSDPKGGHPIEWVTDECFESPVAFAVDAATGVSLPVSILPDAVLPHGSTEYVSQELERQMNLVQQRHREGDEELDANGSWSEGQNDEDEFDEQTIVGALPAGDLFALPLGRRDRNQRGFFAGPTLTHKESLHHQRYHYASASSSANGDKTLHVARIPGRHSSSLQPSHHSQAFHSGDATSMQRKDHHKCHAGNSDYPHCLVDSHQYSSDFRSEGPHFLSETRTADNDPNVAALVVKYQYPDPANGWYIPPPHYYTIVPPPNKRQKRYQKMLRILGSWLPPTIALLFVVSFEMGRRKRQEKQQQIELEESNLSSLANVPMADTRYKAPAAGQHVESVGVIQVFDDVILGYGGHGTVVYKGLLEGRQVAVKRMLRAYHASADREISLLIESDGHPNVVRYFLKEVRGDFVYLALELCDLSLHDLILKLKARWDQSMKTNSSAPSLLVPGATRCILFQIACGVKHLHSLRIVHRDLKPMNILLADSRKKSKRSINGGEANVLELFDEEFYTAKISDMGLGKQLVGQSSFGASLIGDASLRGVSNGGQSSLVGIGPGSVGWQAPEVMALRALPSDASVRSEESGGISQEASFPDASPIDSTINTRTSRSVDIFSLGCVFYSTLLPGCHPFGEWYERESNIMRNRPSIAVLESVSPDALDLISSMILRNPASRPTAAQVCEHPFFWPNERRMSFLCDFSDRIESEGLPTDVAACCALKPIALAVERNAVNVVGLAWDGSLDEDLVSNVQRFRTYDPSSVRDLLRLIRNKHHHFDELPLEVKTRMGSSTSGLISYVESRFPRLLIHCFNICREFLAADDPLSLKYTVPPFRATVSKHIGSRISAVTEASVERVDDRWAPTIQDPSPRKLPLENSENQLPDIDNAPSHKSEVPLDVAGNELIAKDGLLGAACPPSDEATPAEPCSEAADSEGASDNQLPLNGADALIMWEGSTAARSYKSRGWSRSDVEWERRTDAKLRKRDSNLARCAEDPKFRTRLCNYWDASLGTSCPMRKKNKCIFAHGPVELRVKEGKKHRWGKLVDKNGDNSNPNHSGGEDTYGAARSIEQERKQEGKWGTEKGPPAKGKKQAKKKRTE